MVKFQYFPGNIFATKPLGEVTLKQFAEAQKNPKPEMQELFLQIQKAGEEGNLKLKNELKEKLFFFIPSAIMDGVKRGYDNIVKFNPLAVIEYDKLSLEESVYLKHRVFNDFPECCMAYLSPSKTGVKFLFRIRTPFDIEDYKSLYFGLVYHLEKIKEGVDISNERISQPLFLSFDSELLYRERPKQWTKRGAKQCTVSANTSLVGYECEEEPTEEVMQKIEEKIEKMFEKIEDDGHNSVLRICTMCGGIVSGMGFPEDRMISFVHNLIANQPYLMKGVTNYQKTATRFIKSGQNLPILNFKYE